MLQNHNGEDAFKRWRGGSLSNHLEEIRSNLNLVRRLGHYANDEYPARDAAGPLQKISSLVLGKVVWGLVTRAFWPIYIPGDSPIFYGSIVVSFAPDAEGTPLLFDVSEMIREVRDRPVPTDGFESFSRIIRDDYNMVSRIEVPEILCLEKSCMLQSIGILRKRLPNGYLHHRLIPVITHPETEYATIVDNKYWGEEFKRIWMSGWPLLSEEQIVMYRSEYPQVTP